MMNLRNRVWGSVSVPNTIVLCRKSCTLYIELDLSYLFVEPRSFAFSHWLRPPVGIQDENSMQLTAFFNRLRMLCLGFSSRARHKLLAGWYTTAD